MKLGDYLNLGAALVVGTIVFSATAQAAALPPISAAAVTVPPANAAPAVVQQDEVDRIKPVQVRWHHHWHHHHWHHRGWHRGWHHHHWHHHHWRHHRHW